ARAVALARPGGRNRRCRRDDAARLDVARQRELLPHLEAVLRERVELLERERDYGVQVAERDELVRRSDRLRRQDLRLGLASGGEPVGEALQLVVVVRELIREGLDLRLRGGGGALYEDVLESAGGG